MAFRIQKQRSSGSQRDRDDQGGFQIPSSQIRSKPQNNTDVSGTLNNIDEVLGGQPNRMDQLQGEADAAHAAGANDVGSDEVGDAGLRHDMSDSAKDAKSALGSAKKHTGLDLNRPLTDEDKQKHSTKEERAGLGGAAAAGVSGRLAPIAGKLRAHVSGNKKAYGAGGGALGLVGLLIAAFIALLPLKLESMMQGIVADHFEGAVNHAVERRAEMMFFKYVIDASEASGRPIVATGSPLTDLYKTWRAGKFEDQLAKKYGVTIAKGAGNKIRISGPKGFEEGEFADYASLEKYFGDISHSQFRSFLRDSTKLVTRRHQVLMRRHIRLWMRNAYGFRLGKIFNNEKDTEKAKVEVDEKLTKTVTGEYKTRLGKALACMLGSASECPDKTPADTSNARGTTSDGQAASSATETSIGQNITKTTGKAFAKAISTDLIKLLSKKLVPLIGWVDMAAHIDDFIMNNRADAIIKDIRSSSLANDYGAWQVASDQLKSGEHVSGAEVNATFTTIANIEKSCEYQRINQGGPKQGCDPVGDEKKVGAGYGKLLKASYEFNPTLIPAHPALALYLHSPIATILNWFGGIVGWLIDKIPGVTSAEQWISTKFIDLISFIINPGCTGHESGSEAYTCASGGADIVSNDFADQLGAPGVSDTQAATIDSDIALQNDHDEAAKGLWYRVASLDYQHSLLNLVIARIPVDPLGSVLHGANTLFGSTNWLNLASLFTTPFQPQTAYAASPADPFGVLQHRYTDHELSTPIDEVALTKALDNAKADGRDITTMEPDDCPEPDKRPNLCRLDVMAILAQMPAFTHNDDGGLPPEQGTATGTTPGTNPSPTGKCEVNPPGQVANAPVPPNDYTRVQTHGVTLNKRTLAMLTVAEGYFGQTIPLSQGSYNAGGVDASAGTHDGGGAMDVSIRSFSEAQVLQIVAALRKAGFAAWERVPAEGFVHHIHAIAIGDTEASPIAKDQVQDYFNGKSGLAGHGADRNAALGRPYPAWAAGFCQ